MEAWMLHTAAQASCAVLEPELDSVCQKERRNLDLPLALRRFARQFGVEHPSAAMRMATHLLLSGYLEAAGPQWLPVQVQQLCALIGAELSGSKPQPSQTFYSADHYKPRSGHTGKVNLSRNGATIKIPAVDHATARISVAHEIAHLLIHRRGAGYDHVTFRLQSSAEEEAIAEYGARLLLMPNTLFSAIGIGDNLAELALTIAGTARVTIHSVACRLGDPDMQWLGVRGAILWKSKEGNTDHRRSGVTPQWHLCPDAFIPIGKCKARESSLVGKLAQHSSPEAGSHLEHVEIGTFSGTYRVDAFGWGSVEQGTRLVLSIFRQAPPQPHLLTEAINSSAGSTASFGDHHNCAQGEIAGEEQHSVGTE